MDKKAWLTEQETMVALAKKPDHTASERDLARELGYSEDDKRLSDAATRLKDLGLVTLGVLELEQSSTRFLALTVKGQERAAYVRVPAYKNLSRWVGENKLMSLILTLLGVILGLLALWNS